MLHSMAALAEIVAILIGLGLALADQSTALAVAAYGGSRPAQDGTVPALPTPFELDFTEPVRSVTVTVVGPDPSLVASLEPARIVDRTTTFTPLRDLGPGRYLVTWSSVSDVDGSKASGSFAFYVVPEAPLPPVPDVVNPGLDARLN